MSDGVPCAWMRGGTSKGGVFMAGDLPAGTAERDAFLLRLMGSPDPRQIDGLGGGDPLTSKVAIVRPSERAGVDVDYLFLQVSVDAATVSDKQNCGNMLAAVGPFALERGLASTAGDETDVTIFMENTGQVAVATVHTPGGMVTYEGDARIDGVPGTAAPVLLRFEDTAGSSCGALLPTGRATDEIQGALATLVDNGMPVIVLDGAAFGITGEESRADLDAKTELKARIEAIRLEAGPMMNLGDVAQGTTPKITLVTPPRQGGAINTRTFIPHRCHASIGVFGAISVAAACLTAGSVAAGLAVTGEGPRRILDIEHPSGALRIVAEVGADGALASAAIVRTARKLFDGRVFA